MALLAHDAEEVPDVLDAQLLHVGLQRGVLGLLHFAWGVQHLRARMNDHLFNLGVVASALIK